MKVWWVLRWDQYYPSGGLGNVASTHETEEEAAAEAASYDTDAYSYVEYVNIEDML